MARAALLVAVLTLTSAAQSLHTGPNGEALPLGYMHFRSFGFDSQVGKISKPGIEIHYDIGEMAGTQVAPENRDAIFKSKNLYKFVSRYREEKCAVDFGAYMEGTTSHLAATVPEVFANFYVSCATEEEGRCAAELLAIARNYARSLPTTRITERK